MHKVDLLIFDLDGTLVDTRVDLANSVNYVLQSLGRRPQALETIIRNVGDGVRKLLERSLKDGQEAMMATAITKFNVHYKEHLLDHSQLYPGVKDVLLHFAGKKLAVVSNKPKQFTHTILEGLGLGRRFSHIIGGDSLPTLKPSPEPLRHVMKKVGSNPQDTAMIGDSPSDILAGRAAGTITCAVTYGYRERELLIKAGPDMLIDALPDLAHRLF